MNAPFIVAQANTAAGSDAAATQRVIRVVKPQDSQAVSVRLDGSARLDLSEIGNEKVTFVRVGDRLVIVFDNQAAVGIEGAFDANGQPSPNLTFLVEGNRSITGTDFASLFPVTTDQSILPAAGNAVGGPSSGANFRDASVEGLGERTGLDLLTGEDGGGLGGATDDAAGNTVPSIGDIVIGNADDEGLFEGNIGGPGDEDGNAISITNSLNVNFGQQLTGRSLSFGSITGVQDGSLSGLTSGGQIVNISIGTTAGGLPIMIGYTGADPLDPAHQVFTVTLDTGPLAGQYTFTLLQPLDHLVANTEDTLTLSFNFTARDGDGEGDDSTFQIRINDDSPELRLNAPQGEEPSSETPIYRAATVDDEGLDGGNPGDTYPGGTDALTSSATALTGNLGILWGADNGDDPIRVGFTGTQVNGDRSVIFTGGNVAPTDLTSGGDAVHYKVFNNGTVLVAFTGDAPLTFNPLDPSANAVFFVSLSDNGSGSFEFHLLQPLDHSVINAEDNIALNFAFVARDADGDPINGSLAIAVNDDGPMLLNNEISSFVAIPAEYRVATVDDEGLTGGNPDGSSTDNPDASTADASMTGSLGILWGADNGNVSSIVGFTSQVLGDRSVVFAGESVNAAPTDLTSDGEAVRYDVLNNGTLLVAHTGDAWPANTIFDPNAVGSDVVFYVSLSDTDDGSFDFHLVRPLDHGTEATEDDINLNFEFVARDADGDAIDGSFTVTVNDDGPVLLDNESEGPSSEAPAYRVATVDDEGLTGGNPDGSESDDPDAITASATALNGSLGISWGADKGNDLTRTGFNGTQVLGDRSVVFADGESASVPPETLTSHGEAITYEVLNNGTLLVGHTGDAWPEGTEFDLSAIGSDVVFYVTLSDITDNGSFDFHLVRPLDHNGDGTEDDIDLNFNFVARDADGDAIGGSFTVTVNDDGPIQNANMVQDRVYENDLNNYAPIAHVLGWPVEGSNGTSPDGDTSLFHGGVVSTGSLANLVTFGADGAAAGGGFDFAFDNNTDAATAVAGLGLRSKDEAVDTARMYGDWLVAGTDDRVVFALKLNDDGTYRFVLFDQLDHAQGDNPSTPALESIKDWHDIDFSSFVVATDFDGDTITLDDGSFTISVRDDVAEVIGVEHHTVAENDLANFNPAYPIIANFWQGSLGTSPFDGGTDDSSITGLLGTVPVWGYLGDNIKGGADETGEFHLVSEDRAEELLAELGPGANEEAGAIFSHGKPVDDARLITIDGIGEAMGFFADDGRLVFALYLNESGLYNFRMFDQIDHPLGDNPGTNTPEAIADLLDIDLSHFVTYTDADGDTIDLGDGTFVIGVTDDIPVVIGSIAVTLDEDDLQTFNPAWIPGLFEIIPWQGSTGTSPDGDTDLLVGTTSQQGFLNEIIGNNTVNGGADEFGHFGLVSESRAEDILEGMTTPWKSKGAAIDDVRVLGFGVLGEVMGFFAGDRLVFSLTVNELGGYDIRLFDQIDHAYGDNLQGITSLDLSQFITYADFDGDTIDLGSGKFVLKVVDDVPEASGATVTGTVEEEHNQLSSGDLTHGNEDENDASGLDNDLGPDFILNPLIYATANFAIGDLRTLVSTGADEGGVFSLNQSVSGAVMTAGAEPEVVTSKGQTVLLDFADGKVVGFVDANGNGTFEDGDRQVFTVTGTAQGGYTFTLYDQVDHAYGDQIEGLLTLNLGPAVTYTDRDGDSVTLTSGLNIQVIDDVPVAKISGNGFINLDETVAGSASDNGGNNGDESGDTDPFGVGSLIALNSGKPFNDTSSVGADEAASKNYALVLNASATGLLDAVTNGAITLTQDENGNIVGTSAAGMVVFVIGIDAASGEVTVAQYRGIEHDNPADADESGASAASIVSGSVAIQVTITDSDGDSNSASTDLGSHIRFDDDGAVITEVDTAGIAMNWPVEISIVGNISVAYGSDGAAETGALVISGWPTIPGVTATLSSDGLTLTGSYGGNLLYTLTLDPELGSDGYEFTLHQPWPAVAAQTLTVTGSQFTEGNAGNYPFGDVTFTGINPYAGGFGVGSDFISYNANEVENAEGFSIDFARSMDKVSLDLNVTADLPGLFGGTNHGTVTVNWTASNGSTSQSGTMTYNSNGASTLNIDPSIDFTSLQISVTASDVLGLRNLKVTGFTGTTAAQAADDQNLQFQVTAKDGDGDTTTHGLTVHLESVPVVTVVNTTVDEKGLPARNGELAGTGEAADNNPNNNSDTSEANTGTIKIASTDELKEVHFTNEAGATATATMAQLAAANAASPYVLFDDATGKLEIIGYDAGTGTATYRYTLEDNVDHTVSGAEAQVFEVIAVDHDDYESYPVTLTIGITDDAPLAPTVVVNMITPPNGTATLIHDESPFVQPSTGDTNPTNDVASLSAIFAGDASLVSAGPAIGFAQRVGAVTVTPHYGADDNGQTHLSLTTKTGAAFFQQITNFFDTETGHRIFLYTDADGNVLGRVGFTDDFVNADPNDAGEIAFAIAIDDDGTLSFVQYRALLDNQSANDADNAITLGTGGDLTNPNNLVNVVHVTATSTDGDGDIKSATAVLVVRVQDDGPSISTATGANLVVNGQFTDNGGFGGTLSWGGQEAMAIQGWTVTGAALERNPANYLLPDPAGGGRVVDLDATPGNVTLSQTFTTLTEGQSYTLAFDAAKPAGYSAQAEVWWNGELVGTITPSSAAFQQFTITVTAGAGPTNTLEFRETGVADNGGTYLANVSLTPAAYGVVDEDGLDHGNAGGVADVAGVSTFATGSLNINWGTDSADVADAAGIQDGTSANSLSDDVSALTKRAVYFTDADTATAGLDPVVTASLGSNGANPITLTSGGDTVQYKVLENGTKIVGYTGAFDVGNQSNWVFTVSLSDKDSGSYKFNLLQPLDHKVVSGEDNITLAFGYTARDADGDHVNGTLTVLVDDDTPVASGITLSGSESALAGADHNGGTSDDVVFTIQGNAAPAAAGADGYFGGNFSQAFALAGMPDLLYAVDPATGALYQVSINGNNLTRDGDSVTFTAKVNFGGGDFTAFTLTIDEDGHVTYTQYVPLRHGENTSEDASLDLGFQYTIKDSDGDATAPQTVTIKVTDSEPSMTVSSVSLSDVPDTVSLVGVAPLTLTETVAAPTSGADGWQNIDGGAATFAEAVKISLLPPDGQNPELLYTWVNGSLVAFNLNGNHVERSASGDSYTLFGKTFDGVSVFAITVNADGAVKFEQFQSLVNSDGTPFDAVHVLNFAYTVTDGDGDTSAVQTISVTLTDDAPLAVADTYSVAEDGTLIVAAAMGVLANDKDADLDVIKALVVNGPAHGQLTLNADGSFTYTPDANYNGTDTFKYKANDGDADSAVTTVTLTVTPVNDAPVANADKFSLANPGAPGSIYAPIDEDHSYSFNATLLTANDTDIDGDSLTVTGVTNSTKGATVSLVNGVVKYDPTDVAFFQELAAGQIAIDTFTYTIDDGHGGTSTATVTVTVRGTNDAPVVDLHNAQPGNDALIVYNEQLPQEFAHYATLSDVDSDTLQSMTLTLEARPNGDAAESLYLNPAAAAGLSFSYDALTGVLSITGEASVATYQTILQGISYNNTSDAPVTDARSVTVVVNDGTDNSVVHTVTIQVQPSNDAPVLAGDRTATIAEGEIYQLTLDDLNFSDPDNTVVSFIVSGQVHGTIYLGGAPSLSFTSAELAAGLVTFRHDGLEGSSASFNVKVEDGNQDGSVPVSQPFTFTVTNVNDAPTITSGAMAMVAENIAAAYQASVTDSDGPTQNYSLTGTDAALFNISSTGAVTFIAAPNFESPTDAGGNNVYDIIVNVADGAGGTAQQAVAITVTNVNEQPTSLTVTPQGVAENVTGATVGTFTLVDPDTTEPNFSQYTYVLTGEQHEKFEIVGNTIKLIDGVSLDAEVDSSISLTLTATNTDNTSHVIPQNFTVAVSDVWDGPSIKTDSASGANFGIPVAALLYREPNPSGLPLTITSVGAGQGATLQPDGTVTFAVAGATGSAASFTYTVFDGTNSVVRTAYVTRYDTLLTSDRAHATSGDDFWIVQNPTPPANGQGVEFIGHQGNDILVANTAGGSSLYGDMLQWPDTGTEGNGNDLLIGSDAAPDHLFGGQGNDTLYGRGGGDNLHGDAGNDTIYGGAGGDNLFGEAGNDTLIGGADADSLSGGDGNDTFLYTVGDGNDIIDGGTETGTTNPSYDVLKVFDDNTSRTYTINKITTGTEIGSSSVADVQLSYTGADSGVIRMDEIERIEVIGGSAGMTVNVIDTSGTAILPSTIVVTGGGGDDTVNVSNSVGNANIVFNGNGGADTLILGDALGEANWANTQVIAGPNNTFTFTINGHTVEASNVENFQFSNGTVTAGQLIEVAPTDITHTVLTVAENASHGTGVGSILGHDANLDIDTLTYAFVDQNGVSKTTSSDGRFSINAATGAISVADGSLLNFEAATSHNEVVRVTDSKGASHQETITISVTNVYEAPTTPINTQGQPGGSIVEGVVNGALVGIKAFSTDADGDAITYSLTENAGGRFTINAATGLVTVANGALLDFEAAASHAITVMAADASGEFSTRTFTIDVTDVNEAPNAGTDQVVGALENVSDTAVLATVSASDPDVGGGNDLDSTFDDLTYSIVADASGKFEVNSAGQISLKSGASLDYETGQQYHVTVRVTDGDNLTDDIDVTINVGDVNEAPTAVNFTDVTTSIAENANVTGGIMVATLGATDDALGTNVFSLAAGGDSASFEIRGNDLYYIGTSPNFELKPSYSVTVNVNDTQVGNTPDASSTFVLNITDVVETPTVTIATDDYALKFGDVAHLTFTLSDASTTFTSDDVAVAGGTLTNFSGSGTTYTADFLPTASAGANATVQVNGGMFTDADGNNNAASSTVTMSVDTVAPTANIVVADPNLTAGESTSVTITFSEVVTGFTNADLTIENGTLTDVVSTDGVTWTGVFTPTSNINDTINAITLNNGGVLDEAGNLGAGATVSNNYAINTVTNHAPIANNDTYSGAITTVPSNPAGWSQYSGSGHYYKVVVSTLGWVDAKEAAEQAGGYLATISSSGENEFVRSLAANALTGDSWSQGVWLGGSDRDTENAWRWMAGPEAGQAISYTNWNLFEPNNGGIFGEEDRLMMYATFGTWNDASGVTGGAGNFGYVIEYGGVVSNVPTEDTAVVISAASLLANDSDPDAGDTYTITAVGSPTNGTVALSADGLMITFTPSANYSGPASFTYTITDNHGVSSVVPATVSLNLGAVNDAPTDIVWSAVTPSGNSLLGSNATIANLSAVDPDDTNGFSYKLLGGSASNFSVANGVVSRSGGLGTNSNYTLNIEVKDSHDATYSETFTIKTGHGNIADILAGTAGSDILYGLAGADTLSGNDGHDTLFGQNDNDTLNGGAGKDLLVGGAGNDSMTGGSGSDTFAWMSGEQGTFDNSTTYNFDGVTRSTNDQFAYSFEVDPTGTLTGFSNLTHLREGNPGYDNSTEATNSQYDDLESSNNERMVTEDPGLSSDGDHSVFLAQLDIAEAPGTISQITVRIDARQTSGFLSGPSSDEEAHFGIWNYTLGKWETLESVVATSENTFNGTISSNVADYLDDTTNQISIALLNEDAGGTLEIDYVEAVVTMANGTPTTVDTVTDFQTGIGGDVLDLSNLLGAITDSSPISTIDDYLQVTFGGGNTTIHVDHDGGATFQPTMDIVLTGVDLTAGGTFNNNHDILQNMINQGNLHV